MPAQKVCRTCLKESSTEQYLDIGSTSFSESTTIREKLKSCVPEMNISEQETASICSQCVALLESAFVFRTTCLNTEQQLKRISSVYYTELVKILKKKGATLTTGINDPSSSKNIAKKSNVPISQKANTSKSVADSTTASNSRWSITTRSSSKNRTSEPAMPVLEVQEEHGMLEEKRQAKASTSKKRLSEDQVLKQALKKIPALRTHTPEMLECRVAVQKLPASLESALTGKPPPKKKSTKKQDEAERRANKYCPICKKWFDRPHRLQTHNRLVHTKETPYICYHCNGGLVSKIALKMHIPRCHKNPGNSRLLTMTSTRPDFISIASDDGRSSSDLSPPSLAVKTEPLDNAEPITLEETDRPPQLEAVKLEPTDPPSGDPLASEPGLLQNFSEEPIFHCEICGEMFSSEKALAGHRQTHVKCRLCGESFQSEEAKNEHERLHFGTKAGYYYCLVCKVAVRSKDHFNIHMDVRPYSCEYCDKSFRTRGTLHDHRFTHTGERPHHCTFCKKGFIKRSAMLKHRTYCLKNHKKEMAAQQKKAQKHSCNACGKSFDSDMKLKTHVCINAEGQRIFKCHICEMVLIGRKDFILHVKRHFVETESQIDREVVGE